MSFLTRFRKDKKLWSDQEVTDIVKERDWLVQLMKEEYRRLTTPAPSAEVLDSGAEYDIRVPRIGSVWFLRELRTESPILSSVVLKLNQEIFRETKKEGFDWVPKFKFKCPICKTEYKTEQETCTYCPNIPLIPPNPSQPLILHPFFLEANHAEQTFLQVAEEIEYDLEDYDNGYLILLREYFSAPKSQKALSRVVELMRGNPMTMRIVSDRAGRRGGKWWVCPLPIHRGEPSEEPGTCRQTGCHLLLQEVTYVELVQGGSDIMTYYIRGEVIHFMKYNPSRLYGTSLLLTIWILVRTLVLMDRFIETLYEKGRLKGILGVTTKNHDALQPWWEETMTRLRADPHYLPLVGIESDTGRGRFEFISLMESLQDLNYNETKRFIREQICALFGVANIFMADTSVGGGLNNEGLQIAVTDRAVEDGQSVWHTNVFPKLLNALGITDWNLHLRPSREIDEMADAELEYQQALTAQVYQAMGYRVKKTDEGFEISGEAFKVEAPQDQYGTMYGGGYGMSALSSNPSTPDTPSNPEETLPKKAAARLEQPGRTPRVNINVTSPRWTKKDSKVQVFDMIRNEDESGTSGTGHVLTGIIFQDGRVAVRWLTGENPNSTVVYDSFKDFKAIHIDAHPANRTELQFYDLVSEQKNLDQEKREVGEHRKLKDDDTVTKALESKREIDQKVDRIEKRFLNAILELYNTKLLKRVSNLKDLGSEQITEEVTQILSSLEPELKMEAFNQVLRAYQDGKKMTPHGDFEKMAPAFSTSGGKARMARRLLSIIPSHEIYCEPFIGAGSVLLKKEPVETYISDTDEDVVRIWKFLQRGDPKEFAWLRKQKWLSDRGLFEEIKSQDPGAIGDMQRVYRKIFLRRFSAMSQETGWASGNENLREPQWLKSIERFQKYSEQLKGVHIDCRDFKATIKAADSPETFHFIDPPYEEEFAKELIQVLPSIQGQYLVTFSDNETLKKAFPKQSHVIKVRNNRNFPSKTGSGANEFRNELLIANYPLDIPKDTVFKSHEAIFELTPLEKMSAIVGTCMGKTRVARRLISIVPEHKIYNEPCVGGANLFLRKEKAEKNYLNDLDPDLALLYKTMTQATADTYKNLAGRNWTPSRSTFDRMKNQDPESLETLDRVFRKLYLRRYSFNCQEGNYTDGKEKSGPGPHEYRPKWLRSEETFMKYVDVFKGVVVTNKSWPEITKEVDTPETFHFFDPPYNTPKVIEEQSRLLFETVPGLKGKWLITFADHDPTTKYFSQKGFNVNRVAYRNVATTHRHGKDPRFKEQRHELIITNYPVKIPKDTIFKSSTAPPGAMTDIRELFGKPDIQVLRAIYETNPFWNAFAGMTQSISDKLKEVITESYADPSQFTLGNLVKEMRNVINAEAYRLERIARSESTAITAKGREIAFQEDEKQTGLRYGYGWFGPRDQRTTDICLEIERRIAVEGGGKGVPLPRVKQIISDVTKELNPRWSLRDWLPHGSCRRTLVRIGVLE